MEDKFICTRIQAVPVSVIAVVVKIVLRRVVVGALSVIVEAASRLIDESGLLERIHHRLRFNFIDEVDNIFLLRLGRL
jgi:hypothetical protein